MTRPAPVEPEPPVRAALVRVARDVAHEVVVNVLAAAAIGALAFVALGGRVEDLYLRLRSGAPTSGEVALVTIDEEALYLWNAGDPAPVVTPRALLAELVRFLHAAGAKTIVLDVLTDTAQPGDDALAEAARAHGAVVAAERFAPAAAGDPTPFAPASVLGDAVTSGYANLGQEEHTLFSGELLVRGVPLVQGVARARVTGTFPGNLVGAWQDDHAVMPALALAAAWVQRTGRPPAELGAALAGRCGGTPVACTATLADLGLPDAPTALHEPLPIDFRGPEGADGLPVVPAARLLRAAGEAALAASLGVDAPLAVPPDLREALGGKAVVVGRVDAAADDRFVTPYAFPAMLEADMAGMRIHAQLLDTLLSGRHIRRVDGTVAWLAALGFAVAVVGTRRWTPAAHVAGWATGGVALVVAGVAVFRVTDGLAIDVGPSALAIGTALLGVHLYGRAAG